VTGCSVSVPDVRSSVPRGYYALQVSGVPRSVREAVCCMFHAISAEYRYCKGALSRN
jgi:hypothetical protein